MTFIDAEFHGGCQSLKVWDVALNTFDGFQYASDFVDSVATSFAQYYIGVVHNRLNSLM